MTAKMLARPVPGRPTLFQPPKPRVLDVRDLSIVAMDIPGDPFVDVRLLWPHGWATESLDGVAKMASDLVTRSSADLDLHDYAVIAESLGAELSGGVSAEATVVQVNVVAGRLHPALDLLLQGVQRPRLHVDLLERLRREARDARRRRLADPAFVANETFNAAVHPGHRIGRPSTGSVDDLEALTLTDLATDVTARFASNQATVIVTGDLAALDLDALADQVAASAPPLVDKVETEFRNGSDGGSTIVVDRPGAVQSLLVVGHRATVRSDPAMAALALGVGVLGGAFHSRLNLRLREDRGWTYGARATHAAGALTGTIAARMAVQSEVTAGAIEDTHKEIEALVVGGATETEFENVRTHLTQRAPLAWETVAAAAGQVERALALRLGPSGVGDIERALPHVSLDEVNDALRHHLRPGDLVTIVVGDAQRILADLEAFTGSDVSVVPSPRH